MNTRIRKGEESMKKYEEPIMDVIVFETEDVITTSGIQTPEQGLD